MWLPLGKLGIQILRNISRRKRVLRWKWGFSEPLAHESGRDDAAKPDASGPEAPVPITGGLRSWEWGYAPKSLRRVIANLNRRRSSHRADVAPVCCDESNGV